MHPEDRDNWGQGPAPEWDREAVWSRITELRHGRRSTWRQRWAIAAGGLVLLVAGGIATATLLAPPTPGVPDEILPMIKDRVLDDSIAPASDSTLHVLPAARPPHWSD